MKRNTLAWLVLSGALLTPVLSYAEISCTREGMQQAVDLYITAQTKGQIATLPLAKGGSYRENHISADITKSELNVAMKIDYKHSIFDEQTCQSFTEVIVNDKAAPYVLGTRIRVNHDKIAEIETIWTTTGYWLFNAEAYLKYATSENWGPVLPEHRDSRSTLVSAANAYLDAFLDGKKDMVPWGYPCQRVEGGAYTGKGKADDTCDVGVPAGVNIANRNFVVDEVTNSVVVFCTFGAGGPNGGSGAADTHFFRLENGKLRYVHTLTHLLQASFKGTPAPSPAIPK